MILCVSCVGFLCLKMGEQTVTMGKEQSGISHIVSDDHAQTIHWNYVTFKVCTFELWKQITQISKAINFTLRSDS